MKRMEQAPFGETSARERLRWRIEELVEVLPQVNLNDACEQLVNTVDAVSTVLPHIEALRGPLERLRNAADAVSTNLHLPVDLSKVCTELEKATEELEGVMPNEALSEACQELVNAIDEVPGLHRSIGLLMEPRGLDDLEKELGSNLVTLRRDLSEVLAAHNLRIRNTFVDGEDGG